MAQVFMLERSFAIVVNNAGQPGLRIAHPNVEIEASSQDETVKALLTGMEDAGPAIWAVLEETGVAEAMAKLQYRALSTIAQAGSASQQDKANATKALAAWPKDSEGAPRFAQPEELDFLNVCGAKLVETERVVPERVSRRVTF